MPIAIPGGGTAVISFNGVILLCFVKRLRLILVDSVSGDILNNLAALEGVMTQNGNDDPFEVVVHQNNGFSTLFAEILIVNFEGAASPQTLEMHFNGNESILNYNVPDDAIYGHPAAAGVIATAAFDWMTPNTIESFSSLGPSSLISPANTTTVSSSSGISTNNVISIQRNKPDIAGPDGVNTAAVGFGTFFGTSAAAPARCCSSSACT